MLLGCIADDFTGATDLANEIHGAGALAHLIGGQRPQGADGQCRHDEGHAILVGGALAPVAHIHLRNCGQPPQGGGAALLSGPSNVVFATHAPPR